MRLLPIIPDGNLINVVSLTKDEKLKRDLQFCKDLGRILRHQRESGFMVLEAGMKEEKKQKIIRQVKIRRKVARDIAIELGLSQETSKTHLTTKRDKERRQGNLKKWEEE